ncbi:MAG: hypothetical protein AAGG69_01670 [Pseudomonadota bacterium]
MTISGCSGGASLRLPVLAAAGFLSITIPLASAYAETAIVPVPAFADTETVEDTTVRDELVRSRSAAVKELEAARAAYIAIRDKTISAEEKRRAGLRQASETRQSALDALLIRYSEAAERYIQESVNVTTEMERKLRALNDQISALDLEIVALRTELQERQNAFRISLHQSNRTPPGTKARDDALKAAKDALDKYLEAWSRNREMGDTLSKLKDARFSLVEQTEATLAKLEGEAPSFAELQAAEAALSQEFWDRKRAILAIPDVEIYTNGLTNALTRYISALYLTQPPAVLSVRAYVDGKPYYEAEWVDAPSGEGPTADQRNGLEAALKQIDAERKEIRAKLEPAVLQLNEFRQAMARASIEEGDLLYWIPINERNAIIAGGVVEAIGIIITRGKASVSNAAKAAKTATTAAKAATQGATGAAAKTWRRIAAERVKDASSAAIQSPITTTFLGKATADVALNEGSTIRAMIEWARGKNWLRNYDDTIARQYDPNASISPGSLLDAQGNIAAGDSLEILTGVGLDYVFRLIEIGDPMSSFRSDTVANLAIAAPVTAAKALVQGVFDRTNADILRRAKVEKSLATLKFNAFLQAKPYVDGLRQRLQDLDELESVIQSILRGSAGPRTLEIKRYKSLSDDEMRAGPIIKVEVTFSHPLVNTPIIESPNASFPEPKPIDRDRKRWTVSAPVTVFAGDTLPLEVALSKTKPERPYSSLDMSPATPPLIGDPNTATWLGYEPGVDTHHFLNADPPPELGCGPITQVTGEPESTVVLEAGIIDVMAEVEDFKCSIYASVNAGIVNITTQDDLLQVSVMQTYPFPDRRSAGLEQRIEGLESTGPRWHLPLAQTITMQKVVPEASSDFTSADLLWPDGGAGLYEAQLSLTATFFCSTRPGGEYRPVSFPINGTLRAFLDVPVDNAAGGVPRDRDFWLAFPPIPELLNKEMRSPWGNPVFGVEICGTDPATSSRGMGVIWRFRGTPDDVSGNEDVKTLGSIRATASAYKSDPFAGLELGEILALSVANARDTLYTQERRVLFLNWLADTLGQNPLMADFLPTWRDDQSELLQSYRALFSEAVARRDEFAANRRNGAGEANGAPRPTLPDEFSPQAIELDESINSLLSPILEEPVPPVPVLEPPEIPLVELPVLPRTPSAAD